MVSNEDSLETNNIAQLYEMLLQQHDFHGNNDSNEYTRLESQLSAYTPLPGTTEESAKVLPAPPAEQTEKRHEPAPNTKAITMTAASPAAIVDPPMAPVDVFRRKMATLHGLPTSTGFDGDTQPMDSQVYRDYTKSMYQETDDTQAHPADQQDAAQKDKEAEPVDLMQDWPESTGPDVHEISSDHDSDDSGDEAGGGGGHYLLSSVGRPNFPHTPGTFAGQKRTYRGEPVSGSSIRTPGSGLSAFGTLHKAPTMSTTQMFQAQSSPYLNAPLSDAVFSRPSPNIRHSSPLLPFSSPLKAPYSSHSRALTEPRDTYLPMDESQEQRKHQGYDSGDASDQEQDSAELRRARRNERIAMGKHALETLSGIKAPGRHSTRAGKARQVPVIRTESEDRELADRSDPSVHSSEAEDSLDEYDEFAQDIRPSQRLASSRHASVVSEVASTTGSTSPLSDHHVNGHDNDVHEDCDLLSHALHDPNQPSMPATQAQDDQPDIHGDTTIADSQPDGKKSDAVVLSAHIGPSSLSSMVPGSQYPRLSGGDQENSATHVTDPHSALPADMSREHSTGSQPLQSRPPSSPPLLASNHEPRLAENIRSPLDDTPNHNSNHDREETALDTSGGQAEDTSSLPPPALFMTFADMDAQPAGEARQRSSMIPETDPADEQTEVAQGLQSPEDEHKQVHNDPSASQQHLLPSTSPHRPTQSSGSVGGGLLRFADITSAHNGTPVESLHDIDMDIDILTTEDQEYLNAMKPQPLPSGRKRVKLRGPRPRGDGVVLSVEPHQAEMQSNHSASITTAISTSAKRVSPFEDEHAEKENVALDDAQEIVEQEVSVEQSTKRESIRLPPAQKVQQGQPKKQKAKARFETVAPVEDRPSAPRLSVEREGTGQDTLPPLRRSTSPVAEDSPPAKPRSRAKYGKTAARKNIKPVAPVREKPEAVPAASTSVADVQPAPEPENSTEVRSQHEDDIRPNVDTSNVVPTEPSRISPQPVSEDPATSTITFPERVFALFKGTVQAYYPATCLGLSTLDGRKLRVQFEDGTVTQLDPSVVRRLELRRGDLVKVDLAGYRNKVYHVIGLQDKLGAGHGTEQQPRTDIHGFQNVLLVPKDRDSISNLPAADAEHVLSIAVTHLYVTHSMWVRFDDRPFVPAVPFLTSRLQTPTVESSIPGTPSSRSRRLASTGGVPHTRPDLASPSLSVDGIFAGMAFAVTYSSDSPEKDRVINRIQKEGGLILEQGFHELFNPIELVDPDTNAPPPPPKHRPSPAPSHGSISNDAVEALTFTPRAKHLGFVALIADKHSRRAKYIQALALSLPCLSGRWILDSVDAGAPLPWPKYLLPAGESIFLSGAVRSRTLAPYPVATAQLARTFRDRARLLHGDRVLLVGGQTASAKAKWETRKAYAFLTIALGASIVRRVAGLEAARRILEREGEDWKWVYVDGRVEDAERALFGGGGVGRAGGGVVAKSSTARKRKRGEEGKGGVEGREKMVCGNRKVKLVGDEFVVQSLILGELLES